MASTYSNLKFELIGTGDQSGTWGTTTNTNLGTAIEQALVGMATISSGFTGSPLTLTLTLTDTNAAQNARALVLNLTQSLASAGTLNVPAIQKPYMIINATGQTVTVKVTGLTGVAVPTGKRAFLYNNGTDVGNFFNYADTLSLGTDLAVADGGTGISSGTSGGVPYFSASTTIASSAALAANAIVIGGGAGVAPSTTTTGSGILTFLGTPSSANLADAVTDETGSGALVFATSPTLVTPVLGTPTSGDLSNCTADGTSSVGFRNIPQNSQSTAYTLVLADSGKHILHPSADTTARTFTIPANSSVAFPIGTAITFVNQNGAGVVTIAITTDTMRLSPAGTTGSRTLAANGVATCIKLTSTEWIISGTGLT